MIFAPTSQKNIERIQNDRKIEMARRGEISDMYGEATKEWKEALEI